MRECCDGGWKTILIWAENSQKAHPCVELCWAPRIQTKLVFNQSPKIRETWHVLFYFCIYFASLVKFWQSLSLHEMVSKKIPYDSECYKPVHSAVWNFFLLESRRVNRIRRCGNDLFNGLMDFCNPNFLVINQQRRGKRSIRRLTDCCRLGCTVKEYLSFCPRFDDWSMRICRVFLSNFLSV